MPRKKSSPAVLDRIHEVIHVVRGERVILDSDLAALYGTTTKKLLQQFRRNRKRFPSDFAYILKNHEVAGLRSQNVTSKTGETRGGRRTNPVAFTEHGAIMAATILNSEEAVAMSIFVVRAFIRMREIMMETRELARKLDEVEERLSARLDDHENIFEEVFKDIRTLFGPDKRAPRKIGFVIEKS
jgi:hypothetical protein